MIAEKKLETLEHSSARLTVTIDGESAKKEYEQLLQKYSKTAQIKGFRRGKVPPKILEQKFGESIRSEAGMQLVESGLEEVFKEIEQKPLQFEPPTLEEDLDLSFAGDFTFSVTYDVYPQIELGSYEGIEVEQPQVTVGKEDIDRELERVQDQNAIVVDKEAGAKVEKEDIVTIDYAELNEENEVIEGEERQDFTFTVGSGYNRYKVDDELIGLEKDEETVIEKTFEDDFEDSELAGRSVRLRVRVTQIKQKDLPELDDELAQDVSESYETLDDLKKDIKQRLTESVDARVRQASIDSILEQVVAASTIDLPESMIRAELESSWRNFLNRSGVSEDQMLGYLESQERTKDDLLAEWRSGAERSIKTRLVMNEIAEKESIEASEEEIETTIAEQAERSNTDVETARQNFEQAGMLDYLKSQVTDRKIFDFLLDKASIKKGKKTKLLDLLQENQ